jgi:hypothetical protein
MNGELTPWLSVVVANACRDRFRKLRATSVPKSVHTGPPGYSFSFFLLFGEFSSLEEMEYVSCPSWGQRLGNKDQRHLLIRRSALLDRRDRWSGGMVQLADRRGVVPAKLSAGGFGKFCRERLAGVQFPPLSGHCCRGYEGLSQMENKSPWFHREFLRSAL